MHIMVSAEKMGGGLLGGMMDIFFFMDLVLSSGKTQHAVGECSLNTDQ
jgi:hypothetical protein